MPPKSESKKKRELNPKLKAWNDALKQYNAGTGTWSVPKKGTDAYAQVQEIYKGLL